MVVGAGFSIVGGIFPVVLDPSQSVTFEIQFSPTTDGSAVGGLAITTDVSATTQVALNGMGMTVASPPTPQFTVSSTGLNLGDVTINSSATQAVTLTSTGTAPVVVNSATISGGGFSLIGTVLPATLNPGQSMTFEVQFKPVVAGNAIGQLSISSNSSSNGMALISMVGNGVALNPTLSVSTRTVVFGNVNVDAIGSFIVTLASTGTAPLIVSSATVSGAGFSLMGAGLPATLSPGQSMTLQIQFKPADAGSVSGQLAINSNSTGGGITTVSLTGTGVALNPALSVGTKTVGFGNVNVDATGSSIVTLVSTGTAPLIVSSATVSGTGFSLMGAGFPATLSPGQSMTLQIQLKPTVAGTASGQLTINSNSTGGATTLSLTGTGVALSPLLTVGTTSLVFGSVSVNSATSSTVTLTSTGTSPVTVGSGTISGGGFSLLGAAFPATLNPGQSLTLQVQFKPTIAGNASGQLIFNSNSATGNVASVSLSGSGIAANPTLTLNTTILAFGSIPVNSTATYTLTMTSSGTTPVTVNSGSVAGAGFTIVGGSFPVTLNPTQTLVLPLQFKPTTAGAATGQLTLSSNSTTGATAQVALNGTGMAVSHEVDLSWNAPASSPDPVAGYNIYRSTGGGSLVLVNPSLNSSISYVDGTVVSGTTYSYVVKSVDFRGVESDASNEATVTIP
jgi:hypothetical protein